MVSEGLPNLGPVSLWERTLSRLRRAPSLESDHLRKKPSNLLYDVDEVPPLAVPIGVSLQHIFLMSLGWLYVVVIVNTVGGTSAEAQSLIRISMVASGLATGLMVSMSGLQLVALGCPRFAGVSSGNPPQSKAVLVGIATLGAMVAATVWHHVLPMLIGLFVGFSLSIALGVFPWVQFVQSFQDPWISVPRRVPAGF